MRRLVKVLFFLIIFFLLIYLLRNPILRSAGNYLVYADELTEVPVLFVLSGNPFERSLYAADLYHQGFTEKIVCTGEVVPYNIRALDPALHEGNLSLMQLTQSGVPEESIILLEKGRNTWEEANAILEYCREHAIEEFGVLSSSFHTRRIRQTFRRVFRGTDIRFHVFPAPVEYFDPNHWWKDENGVIILNNEYIKLMYYRIKY